MEVMEWNASLRAMWYKKFECGGVSEKTRKWLSLLYPLIIYPILFISIANSCAFFAVTDIALFWPSNAALISSILCAQTRTEILIAIFVTPPTIFVTNLPRRTPIQCLGYAVVNSFEIFLISLLVRVYQRILRCQSTFLNLEYRRHVYCFVLGIATGCSISAIPGSFYAHWNFSGTNIGSLYYRWLGRDIVGISLVSPILINIHRFLLCGEKLQFTIKTVITSVISIGLLAIIPALCILFLVDELAFAIGLYLAYPIVLLIGNVSGAFAVSIATLTVALSTCITTLIGLQNCENEWCTENQLIQLFVFILLFLAILVYTSLALVSLRYERIKALENTEIQVQKRTAELTSTLNLLNSAKVQANEANNEKAAFMAFLCHELKSPAQQLGTLAELLLEENSSSFRSDDTLHQLKAIKLCTDYMRTLVKDVLEVGQFQAGRAHFHFATFDLPKFLNINITYIKEVVEKRGSFLTFHVSKNLPAFVYSEPFRIQQLINNMISNAHKNTPTGGTVELDIYVSENSQRKKDSEECVIEMENLDKAETNLYLHCTVTDYGTPSDPAKAAAMFEPFSSFNVAALHEYGGSGLGLSISKLIVHSLGGTLTYDSTAQGNKTNFVVPIKNSCADSETLLPDSFSRLSLSHPTIAGLILGSSRSFLSHSNDQLLIQGVSKEKEPPCLRILVVDDSMINRKILARMLKTISPVVQIDEAENGSEAVNLCKAKMYAVIFCDIVMPVMDGISATREIRKLGYKNAIVIVTANQIYESPTRQQLNECGATFAITKPFTRDEIRKILEEHAPDLLRQN